MSVADDVKGALMKVASNMPSYELPGSLPLNLLFERNYVVRPADRKTIYPDCEHAAALANAETKLLPVPIRILFDSGPGLFWFHRLEEES